jgi:hypothetical protein
MANDFVAAGVGVVRREIATQQLHINRVEFNPVSLKGGKK